MKRNLLFAIVLFLVTLFGLLMLHTEPRAAEPQAEATALSTSE